jgi:3-(3-hydroxy-phenyl)propionate hydroxylase
LRAAIAAVAPWGWVRPRLILGGPVIEAADVPVLSDLDGKAHGAYGLNGQPALVLVRPDGHIAFRDTAERPERLAAYCRRVFAIEAKHRA